jgi:hypothetical protein
MPGSAGWSSERITGRVNELSGEVEVLRKQLADVGGPLLGGKATASAWAVVSARHKATWMGR